MPQSQPTQLDPQLVTLAKSIRQVESGGNFQAKGASGEYGAYQWEPATWAANSSAAGINVPLDQATPAQQNEVAYKTLASWKSQHPDWNIGNYASAWNAGAGAPDAYLDNNIGTNSKGVSYNTPAYAKKVAETYQQFKGQPQGQNQTPQGQQSGVSDLATEAGAPGSFLSDVGNTLSSAYQGVGKAVNDAATGQDSHPVISGALQAGGAIAGGLTGLLNDAATHLPVVGGLIKGAEGIVGQGIGAAAQTGPGQAVTGLIQAFQQAHPEASADIGSAVNIASLLPIGEGLGAAAKGASEAIPAATRALADSGGVVGDIAKQRLTSQALDMLSPEKATLKATKDAIKTGRVATGGGLSGRISIEPEQKLINAAEATGGLVGKTASETATNVEGGIGDTAKELRTKLKNMEVTPIVQPEELQGLLQDTMAKIQANPYLAGTNAESAARNIFAQFKSYLPQSGDITADDILTARQKLDGWMKEQRGSAIFDPSHESGISISLRALRQGANKLVADKAPDVAVKELLAKQSALYDALDYLAPKVKKEIGTTKITRFGAKHPILKGIVKTGTRYAVEGGVIGNILNRELH